MREEGGLLAAVNRDCLRTVLAALPATNTVAGKMSPRHFVLPLRDVRLLQYGDLHELHVFRGGHLHDIPHWGAPEVHDVEELGARQVHDMEETKLVNKKGAISNH